ncbi:MULTISPECIES: NIPSNAP family protein [Halomonas]|uniref:NIPSNAP family protein n=1 Tax=Halomonas TaxID=2745 RepID=UPI001C967DB1|nr:MULTISPECIES: NIPSNAP family protein [Halomonas]MBY6208635.1 NIPSNAP family protein [Halomonas sp. DP3Y7-2]MBY6227106.1 NIPSNAP family protein [Halomonas sp. DP3Y7-1]MCA0915145.1 NIPSNAP family protein [Halomonas denitrificans]
MIHELRQYTLTRQNWESYWRLFNDVCMPIRKHDFGLPVGAWEEVCGEGVRFWHLWQYDSLEDRQAKRAELGRITEWGRDFINHAVPLIDSQVVRILSPKRMPPEGIETATRWAAMQCRIGAAGKVAEELDDVLSAGAGLWTEEFSNPNCVWVLSAVDEVTSSDEAAHTQTSRQLKALSIPC